MVPLKAPRRLKMQAESFETKDSNCRQALSFLIRLAKKMLPISLILAFAFQIACNKKPAFTSDDKQSLAIDSVARACSSTDSLETLLNLYTKENNKLGIVITERELGKRYRESSRFNDAIRSHIRGLITAEEIHDTVEIIQALNNIDTNFRRLGLLDRASSYHYRALSYCEQYSDKESRTIKKSRVVSFNGIGNILLTLENKEPADSIFRLTLKGEEELHSYLGQAINYANIGSIFESKDEIDSAWVYYKRSLEFNQKANSDLGISLCHISFGHLYERSNQWDKALNEYKFAYDLMLQNSDSWHWLEACLAIAKVDIQKGDMKNAHIYLHQAKEVAENLNSYEHLETVYDLSYQLHEKEGKCQEALECFKKSRAYADSIVNTKNANYMQNLRIKYVRDKSQRELELIKQNYQAKQNLKNIIIIACLSVLLLAIAGIAFLLYALRMRARNQQMMQQVEKLRTNFFTNITHEFRTPLTVILGLGKQIQSGKFDEENSPKRLGSMIVRQGNNLLELINQLLDISKVRYAASEPDWCTDNIVIYIQMLVENFQVIALQKRIDLSFTSSESTIIMDFVPDYVKKIIRNLISNALKYTPENGKIAVAVETKADKFLMKVSDTGSGIDQEDMEHIFEPFFQGTNSRDKVGTGIGLSLVSQVIDCMDGTITVKSSPEKGTEFEITLPLRHGEGEFMSRPTEENIVLETRPDEQYDDSLILKNNEVNENRPTLLIIEDNKAVSYYIGSQLKNIYNIRYAENGEEGLESAGELMPDLIISDLMMPEMDGIEFCKRVRSSKLLNHIPIVIVTAKTGQESVIEMLQAGADAYLYKPFDEEELKLRVSKLLEQRNLLHAKYSEALKEGKEDEVSLKPLEQAFLSKLINTIHDQMSKGELDVETIAEKMCMSRSQLNRKIFAITGFNAAAFIQQIRMGKAKRLLEENIDKPIGEIALECGFTDVAHFSRVFKQLYQTTPSQYRKDKNKK